MNHHGQCDSPSWRAKKTWQSLQRWEHVIEALCNQGKAGSREHGAELRGQPITFERPISLGPNLVSQLPKMSPPSWGTSIQNISDSNHSCTQTCLTPLGSCYCSCFHALFSLQKNYSSPIMFLSIIYHEFSHLRASGKLYTWIPKLFLETRKSKLNVARIILGFLSMILGCCRVHPSLHMGCRRNSWLCAAEKC